MLADSVNSYTLQNGCNALNFDVLCKIFSHLDSIALGRVFRVCKGWQKAEDVEHLWEGIFYRELVFFGPKEWNKHFGDPGDVPLIDFKQAVTQFFTDACKWPDKWPQSWKAWDRKIPTLTADFCKCLIINNL